MAATSTPARPTRGVTPPAAIVTVALLVVLAVIGATRLPALLFPGPQDATSVSTGVVDGHAH